MYTATAVERERERFTTLPETDTTYRETGEGLNTFSRRALYMASRGVPVTPVRPKTKDAFLPKWPESATCELSKIAEWARQFPDHNIGCVAKDGAVWLLDADDLGLTARYEWDTGQQFPRTFTVESRPGHRHYYFRPSDASRKLGNVGQDKHKAFSVRANNEYLVGPGSVHPAGDIYRIVDNEEFAQVPDALIQWIEKQIDAPRCAPGQGGGATPPPASKKIPEGGRNCHLTSVAGGAAPCGNIR